MRKLKIAQIGVRHEHADGKMSTVRLQMSDIFEVVASCSTLAVLLSTSI